MNKPEIIRFVLNGLLATGIHFSVLTFNIQVFELKSAGLANFIAAFFGICASFLGNRYFVFKKKDQSIANQAMIFVVVYAAIACLHGLVLYGWTDIHGFDYRFGFVIATILQVALSYLGNKTLVFKL